jgi:hypothetical protein
MKKYTERYSRSGNTLAVLAILISSVIILSFSFKNESGIRRTKKEVIEKDSVESVRAFMDVYKVLMSPRCMNCHPSGDVPLQGDDSHIHTMLPGRGKDGKGVYAMKCANCHQPTKMEGLHTPPGHPDWHLPPATMKMVFQGKSPEQLAKQILNPKTNGNKNLKQLIEHADDGLVKVGWNMGEGRPAPPLSHEEFKKAWITWLEKGAYAPKAK